MKAAFWQQLVIYVYWARGSQFYVVVVSFEVHMGHIRWNLQI